MNGSLTTREIQILELVATGLEDKQIGERLGLTCQSVRNHLQNIYFKLNANNRTHAVVKWLIRKWYVVTEA